MRIGQSRRHSALESALNIAVGIGVAFTANFIVLPLFGYNITFSDNVWITLIFTVVSFIRSYFLRRIFNYLHLRDIL